MADEPLQGYCVKCRVKREIASAEAVWLGGTGRPATRGVCPECGTAITRFGATSAHEGLERPAPAAPVEKKRRARVGKVTGEGEAARDGKKPRVRAKEAAPPLSAEERAGGPKMVIVVSPSKARTVGRFLGEGFDVEASVGHIRDLPQNRMGVDIEHDFSPRYVIPEKKKEIVKRLQARAGRASQVYLASDPDREGEAIAWHLAAALERQLRGIPVRRVEFHEITQEAVSRAFAQPREIDLLRVDAQQARRILDRVVGYTLSPLLRDKIGRKNLSAGRVQSVALRLICEREREIQAFVPVEFWTIEAELAKLQTASRQPQGAGGEQQGAEQGAPVPGPRAATFIAKLIKIRGKEPRLDRQAEAQAVVDDLEGAAYVVEKVTRQDRRRYPSPPFMTSTLQQEASRKLSYTAKRTMAVAQALYEGKEIGGGERVGLITYMRTDSLHVASAAQAEARQWIVDHYGEGYAPPKPPFYRSPKSAQEAHEAIRPTGVCRDPGSLRPFLTREELQLYTLIWKRFLASQMAPAILDQTVVDVAAGRPAVEKPYLFRATGSVVKFPGFLRVYEVGHEQSEGDEDGAGVRLPPLEKGEALRLVRLLPAQHFTEPPPRYTDASLIRALEEYGIGRPSTYAPTLSTLQERQYVERAHRQLIPTELGFLVNDQLVAFFDSLVNVAFTAEMEEKLDRIAVGEQAWVPMLHEFYGPFSQSVEVARERMPRVELRPEATGELCPECGNPLVLRLGRFGKFVSCSGWPKCRYRPVAAVPDVTCPQCGGAVVQKRGKRGKFYACANYRPDDETACRWTSRRLPKAGRS
jgi:DNA topoisomerase-1